tara:strand:+ start:402 stop:536 length:135 start_codon:yes stop_codon:yes gene_type:complete
MYCLKVTFLDPDDEEEEEEEEEEAIFLARLLLPDSAFSWSLSAL